MSIKIQINSLEALERLIGGDTDLEIGIRKNIVQEFVKKHLKAIVSDESVSKYAKSLHDSLQKILEDRVFKITRGVFAKTSWGSFTLSEEWEVEIKNQITKQADSLLKKQIRKYLDENWDPDKVKIVADDEVLKRIRVKVMEELKNKLFRA